MSFERKWTNQIDFIPNDQKSFFHDELITLKDIAHKLNEVCTSLEDMEIRARAEDLVIAGIPVEFRNKESEIFNDLCNILNCDGTRGVRKIFSVVVSKTSMIIVVQFNDLQLKSQLYLAYKKMGNLSLQHLMCCPCSSMAATTRIYFNDGITKKMSRLFYMAKYYQLKLKTIHKCFTRFGKVYVVVKEGEPGVVVRNKEMLDELIAREDQH